MKQSKLHKYSIDSMPLKPVMEEFNTALEESYETRGLEVSTLSDIVPTNEENSAFHKKEFKE